MARKKVNIAWIANGTTRKATFKKRQKGLMKKARELATLCNVDGCAIVFGPREASSPSRPEVWPSMEGAMEVLSRFKSLPHMEQSKKKLNQEGFLRLQAGKLREQLRKKERENRELELTVLLHEAFAGRSLHDVGIEDVTGLAWMVNVKMMSLQERIEHLKEQMKVNGLPAAEEKTSLDVAIEAPQNQNCFMDEFMPFGGEEMTPFGWPESFFPFN